MLKNGLIQIAPALVAVAPIVIFVIAMMKIQTALASFTLIP